MSSLRIRRRHLGPRARMARFRPGVEAMERRELLATFVVNNPTDDPTDPAAGSLRAVILEANANPGLDTIVFQPPQGQTTLTINVSGNLPAITSPVRIDGTILASGAPSPNYANNTPFVTIAGASANGDGLTFASGSEGSTVRGLAITGFGSAANPRAGIRLTSGGHLIVSNFIGVNRTGGAAAPNGGEGIVVTSANNTIGGTNATPLGTLTVGNLISGNGLDGIALRGAGALNNVIQGNFIGTNRAGVTPLANGGNGVLIEGASNNTVGGTTGTTRNVISGNTRNGVLILSETATENVIQGNSIGTDAAGSASGLGNRNHGVLVNSGRDNTIGGVGPGTGNFIAFNGFNPPDPQPTTPFAGVAVTQQFLGSPQRGTGNSILRNAISENSGLGIDLGHDGVTPNFVGIAGPNDFQTYPDLFQSASIGNSTRVQGRLASLQNTTFTIQFFENSVVDITGFGEGERFAGSTTVTTNANGLALIDATLSPRLPIGTFLTATATDPNGNTSEFSSAITVQSFFQVVADLEVRATADLDEVAAGEVLTYAVTARNNGFSGVFNPIVTTTLPESVEFLPGDNRLSFDSGTRLLTFSPGPLNPFQEETVQVSVRPSEPGTLSTVFTISGSLFDPTPANNVAIVDTEVVLDPATAVLAFQLSNNTVGEGDGVANVVVERSNNLEQLITVEVVTIDGQAVAGQDFLPPTENTLTFEPGQRFATYSLPILNNQIVQGNRSLQLRLQNPSSTSILGTPRVSTLTIFDNDPGPQPTQFLQFEMTNFNVLENARDAVITVTRTGSQDGRVTVNFATSDGTAIAGTDYNATQGTLVFNDGEATKSFTVRVRDNDVMDGNRNFFVTLSGSTASVIGTPATTTVTIIDDETPLAGFFQFSQSNFTVNEAAGEAVLTVTRLGGFGPATINFLTTGGTAVPGVDFQPVGGSLQFAEGETSKTINIPINVVPGFQPDRTVLINLSPTGDAAIGDPGTVVLTITDSEAPPVSEFQFNMESFSVLETAGQVQITITRTNAVSAVEISFATALGSAMPGVDFAPVAQRLSFAPGEASKTIAIPIFENSLANEDRTVGLFLGFPSENAQIGALGEAVLTIVNVDRFVNPPQVQEITMVPTPGGFGEVLISFTNPLDPTAASSPFNYSAALLGTQRISSPSDRLIGITTASLDTSGRLLTLTLAEPIPAGRFLTVAINAAPGGVSDTSGNLLDGNRDGNPGGTFLTTIGRGTRLNYRDANGDFVSLSISGGGILELTRDQSGEGQVLRVLNPRLNRTVVQGGVQRASGGNGTTTLQRIDGLDPFGRVRTRIQTPPIFVGTQLTPSAVDSVLAQGLPGQRARRR